ncbi:uncharacterized protein B0H64DRAFT_400826 [Chaetomium fimeti]|uniref:Uncharacterized protein n=1 Tax=Chaetomium fimeti TaxID=1854472 RepID=A0AAE0HDM8_9PEZI|nr:hypothetical protein B0H64DRAFT_400826 [Chaetomium fimeti]
MFKLGEDSAMLGFYISFEPRRLYLEFRTDTQAEEYLKQIKQRSVYKANSLDGEQQGRVCSLRLPSRIVSASVWGSEIYLTFNDKTFASDWVNGLLVWVFRKNQDGTKSETDVCLYSAATTKQLNKALGISEHGRARPTTNNNRGVPHRVPESAITSAPGT